MEYLGREPHRWKNRAENPSCLVTRSPDHLSIWSGRTMRMYRARPARMAARRAGKTFRGYGMTSSGQWRRPRAAHPELNLTPEKIGFQPWEVSVDLRTAKQLRLREYRKLKAANQGYETC